MVKVLKRLDGWSAPDPSIFLTTGHRQGRDREGREKEREKGGGGDSFHGT
jgi:hypothetical protein